MLAILSLFIGILPKTVLAWMQTKNDAARIAADIEIAKRDAQAQVLIAETEHWIAWLPRFVIAGSVAVYTGQVFISSMLHHPEWGPLKLPSDFIWVMTAVVSGLFLEKVVKTFK